jgi:hypothetical protein
MGLSVMSKPKAGMIVGAFAGFFVAMALILPYGLNRKMSKDLPRETAAGEAMRRETVIERKMIELESRVRALEARPTRSLISPGIDSNIRAIRDLPDGARARF